MKLQQIIRDDSNENHHTYYECYHPDYPKVLIPVSENDEFISKNKLRLNSAPVLAYRDILEITPPFVIIDDKNIINNKYRALEREDFWKLIEKQHSRRELLFTRNHEIYFEQDNILYRYVPYGRKSGYEPNNKSYRIVDHERRFNIGIKHSDQSK